VIEEEKKLNHLISLHKHLRGITFCLSWWICGFSFVSKFFLFNGTLVGRLMEEALWQKEEREGGILWALNGRRL